MSAYVLLNLLNEFGKKRYNVRLAIQYEDLLSFLSLFRKELNEFNNTEARKLDSIYCMTLKLLSNRFFVGKG